MLRDPHRLDCRDQGPQPGKMALIEGIARAQGHADAMQTDGVVLGQLVEYMKSPAVGLKIVFAVNFQPANIGAFCQQSLVVRGAQANSDGGVH